MLTPAKTLSSFSEEMRFILQLCTIAEELTILCSFVADTVSLVFAGDISFSDPVRSDVQRNLCSYNDTLIQLSRYIREADIAIGNLESSYVPKKAISDKYRGGKMIFKCAERKTASALRLVHPTKKSLQQRNVNKNEKNRISPTDSTLSQNHLVQHDNQLPSRLSFEWSTVKDFIHRLKRQNNLVQHKIRPHSYSRQFSFE